MRVYLETNSPEKQTQIAAQMEHLINQQNLAVSVSV